MCHVVLLLLLYGIYNDFTGAYFSTHYTTLFHPIFTFFFTLDILNLIIYFFLQITNTNGGLHEKKIHACYRTNDCPVHRLHLFVSELHNNRIHGPDNFA